MTDPQRLIDEGASDFERELLSAWQDEQPSGRARRRALALAGAGAATTLTAAATAQAAATTAQAAASAAPKASLAIALVKWLGVGFVAGLATSGVALHYAAPLPPARPAMVSHAVAPMAPPHRAAVKRGRAAPRPAVVEPTAAAPAAAPPRRHEVHRATAPTEVTAAAAAPAPSSPHGSLGPETAALDRARSALQSGHPTQALALVADYQRRFPAGMLAQEAAVLRIDALDKQGNRAEAIREARRFLAEHPDSPHAERLQRLMGGAHNP